MPEGTKHTFAFRCMAYKGTNQGVEGYFAICLDLNVSTWRENFEDAKASLTDAVLGYLDTVTSISKAENIEELKSEIFRPAPIWPYQLMYYGLLFRHYLRPTNHDKSKTFEVSPALS